MLATAQQQPNCKLTEELMLVSDMINYGYGRTAFTPKLLTNWMKARGVERTLDEVTAALKWLAAAGYIERIEGKVLWRRTQPQQPHMN